MDVSDIWIWGNNNVTQGIYLKGETLKPLNFKGFKLSQEKI